MSASCKGPEEGSSLSACGQRLSQKNSWFRCPPALKCIFLESLQDVLLYPFNSKWLLFLKNFSSFFWTSYWCLTHGVRYNGIEGDDLFQEVLASIEKVKAKTFAIKYLNTN